MKKYIFVFLFCTIAASSFGQSNKTLTFLLENVFKDDQQYRLMEDSIAKKHGYRSNEVKDLWEIIHRKDSSNLVIVKRILDKYGWLGADVVGQKGNDCLFLVIQHADLKAQEYYLPMMKEAVKNKKANASSLALLMDRIEMRNGRPQIYGSQINTDSTGKSTIYKMLDEPNVNKRRQDVGLQPLEEYVKFWNIDYHLPKK